MLFTKGKRGEGALEDGMQVIRYIELKQMLNI